MFETYEQCKKCKMFLKNIEKIHAKACRRFEMFQCDLCSFSSCIKSTMRRHMKIHQAKRNECKECGTEVKTNQLLVWHLNATKCKLCSEEFRCRTLRNDQIKEKNVDERGYLHCPREGCKSRTKTFNTLRVHLRELHGEKQKLVKDHAMRKNLNVAIKNFLCDHCDHQVAIVSFHRFHLMNKHSMY